MCTYCYCKLSGHYELSRLSIYICTVVGKFFILENNSYNFFNFVINLYICNRIRENHVEQSLN
jgi:hypothetical protein